ncbi:MAG TPA: hypothetical protein VNM37_07980, partial [Candidatus Dormibacteraeota bacterium]|nr:hypothetical protein [Candidatus Dormibacteraeota bacterium]
MTQSAFTANLASGTLPNGSGWVIAESGQGGAIYAGTNATVNGLRTIIDANVVLGATTADGVDSGGGGICNHGKVTLVECELRNNRVSALTIQASHAKGGAILNSGTLVLSATTLADNLAEGESSMWSGALPGPGSGGGIYNEAMLACTNTTFATNEARGGRPLACFNVCNGEEGRGGALNNAAGTVLLTHVTFAGNRAVGGAPFRGPPIGKYGEALGGAIYTTNGTITLKNSLLAHGSSGTNCVGNVVDAGHNISSDGSCQFTATGSLNNTDPKVSPLDDFGGPTRTVALLSGS